MDNMTQKGWNLLMWEEVGGTTTVVARAESRLTHASILPSNSILECETKKSLLAS